MILQADYDADKVEAKLRKAMEYKTIDWQDHTLHTVTLSKQGPDEKGPSGDEQMTVVLVAQSEKVAKKMHRILDGIIADEELWAEGSTTSFNWQGDESTVLAGPDTDNADLSRLLDL